MGRSENSGATFPLGRPRCEASTTAAPALRACWIVGTTARSRVSSVTVPPSSGALRSARTKTRRPARSSCAMVSFANYSVLATNRIRSRTRDE